MPWASQPVMQGQDSLRSESSLPPSLSLMGPGSDPHWRWRLLVATEMPIAAADMDHLGNQGGAEGEASEDSWEGEGVPGQPR